MKNPDRLRSLSSFLHHRRLRIDILTTMVGLLVVTMAVSLFIARRQSMRAIRELSEDLTRQVTETVIEKTTLYLMTAARLVETIDRMVEQGALSLAFNDQIESFFIEILKTYPQVTMINIGDEEGNFFMPKKLPDGGTVTKIINRTATPPRMTLKYRDANGNLIRAESTTEVDYDPRDRPWYRGAKESGEGYWTDVYIFFTDRQPGITASYPVHGRDGKLLAVFGADIVLNDLSRFLGTLRIGKSGIAFILNDKDEIIAHPNLAMLARGEDEHLRPTRVHELGDRVSTAFREHDRTGEHSFTFKMDGENYNAAFADFPESFQKDWKIGVVVPENEFVGPLVANRQRVLIVIAGILLLAVIVAMLIARNISRPIVQLAKETEKIRDFHLDDEISIRSSIKEIQLMTNAISSMKTGLRAFRRYVPAVLVRQLIKTGEEARIGGKKLELTVFFSDITGFTTVSEGMPPEKLMIHLSEYFDELTKIVIACGGTVDKYIGDALMAFWGAPHPDGDQAIHACRAALLCREKVAELNARWEKEGKVTFPTRIGIHTGQTVVGNMGSEERMNYSAVGETVNVASRLEEFNKKYGTRIIVSRSTYEKASDRFTFRPLDRVPIRGMKREILIYELVGERDSDRTIRVRRNGE